MPSPESLPDVPALSRAQAAAEAEGRQCVVGALIRDAAGRALVLRRAPSRVLFPGCWDLPGGHVEPGESLPVALAREVHEETGWELARIRALVHVFDWETVSSGRLAKKREFHFLVEVTGDLNRPRLERGQFTECRWIGREEVPLVKEGRGSDDVSIYESLRRVLSPGQRRVGERAGEQREWARDAAGSAGRSGMGRRGSTAWGRGSTILTLSGG